MCLITRDPTVKVAEQDIVVYKQLRYPSFLDSLFGAKPEALFYDCYTYKKNQLNEVTIPLNVVKHYDCFRVEAGFHSYVNREENCNAKFIIPKGTKYVAGTLGHSSQMNYVSEAIIYKGKL